jgi:hypothetical protein
MRSGLKICAGRLCRRPATRHYHDSRTLTQATLSATRDQTTDWPLHCRRKVKIDLTRGCRAHALPGVVRSVGGVHSSYFAECFPTRRVARAAADACESRNSSRKKLHDLRKNLLASARCRTRQFLPGTILINAMEILPLWRVKLSRVPRAEEICNLDSAIRTGSPHALR